MIQKFRQLHLSQQSKEREYLDQRKILAAKCDDEGNPLRLFLFSDGFTIYTCNTPRFSRDSKGDKVIETRIVGTEVLCGPIKTHRDLYVPHVTPKVTQSYPKKQKVPGYRYLATDTRVTSVARYR